MNIELLESRIAPAGLVLAAYDAATGELTLTDDGGGLANDVSVFQTGVNTYRIQGNATDINVAANTFLDIGKLTKLTIDGGAGGDTFTLTNLRTLTAFSFSGGSGDDDLFADTVTVKGNVEIDGNAGEDFVKFGGLFTRISGNVTADSTPAATDRLFVDFNAQTTVIGGSVLFTGGGNGTGSAFRTEGDGSVSIAKGVNFNPGTGGGFISLDNDSLLTIGKLPTGESIRFTGGAGSDALFISPGSAVLAGGISMTGDAENDAIDFGNNPGTVKVGKLATGQSILFDGGSGSDTIFADASSLTLAGGIDFVAGAGFNSITLDAPDGTAKIGKLKTGQSIRFSGGADDDTLTANRASLTLAGGIEFAADAGTNSLSVGGVNGVAKIGKFATGQSIFFTGTTGDDTLTTNSSSLTLAGGIDFTGEDGTNLVNLMSDGDRGAAKIGKLAAGQSILFNGGSGSDDITSVLARVTLAGGIELNGAGGDNDLEFDDNGVVKIGKFGTGQSLLFTGTADGDNEPRFGGVVTLAGSVEVMGGTGGHEIDLRGKVSVGKSAAGVSVLLLGGDGSDRLDFGDNITLAGSMKLVGGLGGDSFEFTQIVTLTVKGAVEFDGGAGNDRIELDGGSTLSVVFGSSLTFTGGDDTDAVEVVTDGSIAGNVSVDLGSAAAGTQDVIFQSKSGLPSGLILKGSLLVDADAGNTTADFLTMTNVSVAKLIDLKLGGGISTVNIDNLIAGDEFKLDTRGGADVVNIERGNFFGGSVIKKLATIQLGLGDDQLLIGNPVPTVIAPFPDHTRVNFIGGLTADGGAAGTDNRNDIVGENDGVLLAGLTGFELTTLV